MSRMIGFAPRLADLVDGVDLTPETVSRLAAVALMQAHITAEALRDAVIPSLEPSKRGFAKSMAGRIARREIFTDQFLQDLEALNASLGIEIDRGTHVYWHGDDNHVRGGYRSIFVEPNASALTEAKGDLAMLRDTVLATLCGARALYEAGFDFKT